MHVDVAEDEDGHLRGRVHRHHLLDLLAVLVGLAREPLGRGALEGLQPHLAVLDQPKQAHERVAEEEVLRGRRADVARPIVARRLPLDLAEALPLVEHLVVGRTAVALLVPLGRQPVHGRGSRGHVVGRRLLRGARVARRRHSVLRLTSRWL